MNLKIAIFKIKQREDITLKKRNTDSISCLTTSRDLKCVIRAPKEQCRRIEEKSREIVKRKGFEFDENYKPRIPTTHTDIRSKNK